MNIEFNCSTKTTSQESCCGCFSGLKEKICELFKKGVPSGGKIIINLPREEPEIPPPSEVKYSVEITRTRIYPTSKNTNPLYKI
jgi:hypothetical protein